jgi:hypothetical protein
MVRTTEKGRERERKSASCRVTGRREGGKEGRRTWCASSHSSPPPAPTPRFLLSFQREEWRDLSANDSGSKVRLPVSA